jgi:hypothetical protein
LELISMAKDYDVNDYLRQRPRPAWEEFGSEGDGEREVRLARERSQGRTRKSSAEVHQDAADQRQAEIRQDRQAVREQVRDRNEAERAERERYRGVRSADILAEPIVQPGRRVGALDEPDEFDPVARNRANRKLRELAKRRERGW